MAVTERLARLWRIRFCPLSERCLGVQAGGVRNLACRDDRAGAREWPEVSGSFPLFLRLRFPIHLAGGNIDPELGKGAFGTSSRGGSPLIVPVPKSGGLAASGCLVLSARGFLGGFGHSINMPMGPALSKRPSGWSRSRWRCSGWRRSEAHCAPARSLPTAGFHFLAQHPERHIVWRGSSSRRPRL
jgi:hypothetical protein